MQTKLPINLDQTVVVGPAPAVRLPVHDPLDLTATAADRMRMHGWFRISEVLAIQVQNIGFAVERTKHYRYGVPPHFHSVCPRPVPRNLERRNRDLRIANRIDGAVLTRNRRPRHRQSHDTVIMLAGGRPVTHQSRWQPL